jgi:hypothetical protein
MRSHKLRRQNRKSKKNDRVRGGEIDGDERCGEDATVKKGFFGSEWCAPKLSGKETESKGFMGLNVPEISNPFAKKENENINTEIEPVAPMEETSNEIMPPAVEETSNEIVTSPIEEPANEIMPPAVEEPANEIMPPAVEEPANEINKPNTGGKRKSKKQSKRKTAKKGGSKKNRTKKSKKNSRKNRSKK